MNDLQTMMSDITRQEAEHEHVANSEPVIISLPHSSVLLPLSMVALAWTQYRVHIAQALREPLPDNQIPQWLQLTARIDPIKVGKRGKRTRQVHISGVLILEGCEAQQLTDSCCQLIRGKHSWLPDSVELTLGAEKVKFIYRKSATCWHELKRVP